jgi:phage terminase large subunit-like protein
LKQLLPSNLPRLLASCDGQQLEAFAAWWEVLCHEHQRVPLAAQGGGDWTTWLLLGGRGAGKTHAGAAWVRGLALGKQPYAATPVGRIALIGESEADVREVMIEGVSGLLAAHHHAERPAWIPSRRRLEWKNGAVAQAFSAEDPESLRGPQFGAAWCDEIAKWRHGLWAGKIEIINGVANLSGLIMTYMAARFGVLGVYVSGRSREKEAALTGAPAPSVVGQVVKAIARRK